MKSRASEPRTQAPGHRPAPIADRVAALRWGLLPARVPTWVSRTLTSHPCQSDVVR